MFKKAIKHLGVVMRHKWEVGKVCFAFGLYWQGIVHDMSKLGPTEFWPSAKYYQGGKASPLEAQKIEQGYSMAWLHHKACNKHHPYYWIDYDAHEKACPCEVPAKYVYEMVADWIGAGKVYGAKSGKEWSWDEPLKYWLKHNRGTKSTSLKIWHPKTRAMLDAILYDIAKDDGLEYVIPAIKDGDYEDTDILGAIHDEMVEEGIIHES